MTTKYGRMLLCLLMVAFSATPVHVSAQGPAQDGPLLLHYDVDSSTLTYCRSEGNQGNPLGGPVRVNVPIKTVGASTTITGFAASTSPFRGLAAGDVLIINVPTATDADATAERVIVTWTSADSVDVDSAVTLTGAAGHLFGYYKTRCGTASTDGWINTPPSASSFAITMLFEQGDITSLVARWECRASPTSNIVILYPGESSDCGLGGTLSVDRCNWLAAQAGLATGSLTVVDEAPSFGQCRVGLAWVGADPGDAAAAREKVSLRVAIR